MKTINLEPKVKTTLGITIHVTERVNDSLVEYDIVVDTLSEYLFKISGLSEKPGVIGFTVTMYCKTIEYYGADKALSTGGKK